MVFEFNGVNIGHRAWRRALEAEGSKIKAENLRLTDNCNVLPFG